MFEVPWVDDQRNIQINRGYRVQFNNAIGPYNRGFRFHPSVNHSILKFLGFEQIFKNRLIFLSMAGAKGANDFEYPEGKSYREFMRFCQSFMLELWKMVGPEMDVPAVDIGLGALEITYLYGMYKKLVHEHNAVFKGKGIKWGGSLNRLEATVFGVLYFAEEILLHAERPSKAR